MTYAAPLFFNWQNKLETSLLLPLRNVVLLPGITIPVITGKPRSVAVVESTMLTDKKQFIIAAIRPQARQKIEESEMAQNDSDLDQNGKSARCLA